MILCRKKFNLNIWKKFAGIGYFSHKIKKNLSYCRRDFFEVLILLIFFCLDEFDIAEG